MEDRIEFIYHNDCEGFKEFLDELEVKEKVLELLKNKKIRKIEITYKNESV